LGQAGDRGARRVPAVVGRGRSLAHGLAREPGEVARLRRRPAGVLRGRRAQEGIPAALRMTMTKRRRRQRTDRGAIVVELILVTILVLCFVWWGIDYFRIGYKQRLTAMGESQTKAWQLSYPNGPQCFLSNPTIG